MCRCLVAMDGYSGVDDLLHLTTDGPRIFNSYWTADVQIDIIAIGYRDVDSHLAGIEKRMGSLTEYEKQAAGVGTRTTGGCDIEKLYILWGIQTKVHTLYLIIYVRAKRTVFHLQA